MKKLLSRIIFVALFSWLLGWFLPWWIVVLPGICVGFFGEGRGGGKFFAGFFGILFLWMLLGMWTQWATGSALPSMVAEVFTGMKSPWIIAFLSGAIGGIAAGLGGLCGNELSKINR